MNKTLRYFDIFEPNPKMVQPKKKKKRIFKSQVWGMNDSCFGYFDKNRSTFLVVL